MLEGRDSFFFKRCNFRTAISFWSNLIRNMLKFMPLKSARICKMGKILFYHFLSFLKIFGAKNPKQLYINITKSTKDTHV